MRNGKVVLVIISMADAVGCHAKDGIDDVCGAFDSSTLSVIIMVRVAA